MLCTGKFPIKTGERTEQQQCINHAHCITAQSRMSIPVALPIFLFLLTCTPVVAFQQLASHLPSCYCSRRGSSTPSSSSVLHAKKDWTTSLFPVRPVPFGIPPANETTPSLPPPTTTKIVKEPVIPPADKGFVSQAYCQFYAGSIGALTGFGIAGFKLSIEAIREYAYEDPNLGIVLIPALGGAAVALLAVVGGGSFPPGVRGIVDQADRDSLGKNSEPKIVELVDSARKAAAAICTLGTGCSLGPEGPGVEIGIAASRVGALAWPWQLDGIDNSSPTTDGSNILNTARILRRNRLFLACGAAAGVSSGFNAPLAGVFFALEVIQRNLPPIDLLNDSNGENSTTTTIYEFQQESLSAEAGSITPILTSSVVSALVIRILLGNELALRLLDYEIPTPLRELPIYLLLGATSGLIAVIFSQTAQIAKAVFDGEFGPQPLRETMEATPDFVKPIIGGLICGLVGYFFPNILFFGYETLNGLLLNNQIETSVAVTLLVAKIVATAVSAASGLVGGTLAPSLFMGGMVGVSFHNTLVSTLDVSTIDFTTSAFGSAFEIADLPAYTMVGAASFLAAVFRAPLTASLLAFELTKNYDVLVPLLASAGVGTLFCDLVESRLERAGLLR